MMSTGSIVTDGTNWAVSVGFPMLMPVYSTKGIIMAISLIPGDIPLLPISADIPKVSWSEEPLPKRIYMLCSKILSQRVLMDRE